VIIDNTNTYWQIVDADSSSTALESVKALAKDEGYRIRTVRSVRLVTSPTQTRLPRYRVELAVERGA
jgi:hypothetical protein